MKQIKQAIKEALKEYRDYYKGELEEVNISPKQSLEDIHNDCQNLEGNELDYHCGYVSGLKYALYLLEKGE